jgi:hypothetical protein
MKIITAIAGALAAVVLAAGCQSSPSPAAQGSASPAAQATLTQGTSTPHHHHRARASNHRHHHRPARVAPVAGRSCIPGLWSHVYHSYRLHVIKSCTTVTGTVKYISAEPDGDLHIDILLDPAYAGMINAANRGYEYGELVTEAICLYGPITQADAAGPCHGLTWKPAIPAVGDRVAITGSYVIDTDHGWAEIHPVSNIRFLSGSVAAPPPTSTVPEDNPPPPVHHHHAPPPPPAAAWCSASASYNSSYGDWDVYVHSNQDDKTVTASDGSHSKSWHTDSSGYADVYLAGASPGSTISVTVGGAHCSTTAG